MLLTCEIHGLKLKEGTRKGSQPPMLPFEDTGSRQSSRRASCARSSERQQAQPECPCTRARNPKSLLVGILVVQTHLQSKGRGKRAATHRYGR